MNQRKATMKVLLFKRRCGAGGVQTWISLHAQQLRRLGVECDLWFFERGTRYRDFMDPKGIRWGDPAALATALERQEYDVVHIVTDEPYRDLIELVRPAPKLIVTSHGELSDPWSHDSCFAFTGVSKGTALLNEPLTDLEVEVTPYGVDPDRFTPIRTKPSGPPIIAWAGRTGDVLQKDFPRFLRVAWRLAQEGLRFWVAD